MTLEQGRLGYSFLAEKKNLLEYHGDDPSTMLKRFAVSFPAFNTTSDPLGVVDIENQASQGSCQGHAASTTMEICFFLATGRKAPGGGFSRGGAYYLSQQHDGIIGDRGSTLSGGQYVLTQHGLCTEQDWPYPSSYNPRQPEGITFPFKLKASRPIRTVDEFTAWIDAGLPVQHGLLWNDSCNQEVVSNWQPMVRSGGHSCVFWLRKETGNFRMINSWGKGWNGDGCNEWTEASIARALRHQFTVMVGYAPDEMSFPQQEPLAA